MSSDEQQDEDAREIGAEGAKQESAKASRRVARSLIVRKARAESNAKCVMEAMDSTRVGGCRRVVKLGIDLASSVLMSLWTKASEQANVLANK